MSVASNGATAEDSDAPSAELLLYLAEFADERGQPEDPMAVDDALTTEQKTATKTPTDSAAKAKPDDAKADAKPADQDR